MRVKVHPTLGILVGTDGHVMVPANGTNKAHWTYGSDNGRGYRRVCIGGRQYAVHRLVAEAFLQFPIPEGYQIDHLNRVKHDNRLENIRICTPSENSRNTPAHDRVEEQGRTHYYEDKKQAHREHNSRYYDENKDRICEHNARYRADNKDRIRERKAQYSAENKDRIREYQAHYYVENKDKLSEQYAHYYAENKDKVREQKVRYNKDKRKTHKQVYFADGSRRWVPLAEAEVLLALPRNQRIFNK